MPSTTSDAPSDGAFHTRGELDALGIGYPEPPDVRCEHCGRALPQKAMVVFGSVMWIPDGECGCEESALAKQAEADEQRRRDERVREEKRLSCGIEKRYLNAEVSNGKVASYLAHYNENEGIGLFVTGGVGSGKTYLVSAVARRLIDAGKRVRMVTSADMLASIQRTFDSDSPAFETIRAFGTCGLLVIDDLGKESASDWSLSTLFQIIDMRYRALLPTVVTSQYSFSRLIERFSRRGDADTAEAIVSRLKESCICIDLGTRNRRLEGRGKEIAKVR